MYLIEENISIKSNDNCLTNRCKGPLPFHTPLLVQVPQRHPKSPLIIWVQQSTSCRELVTSRMANSPMLNSTTFLGAVHNPHRSRLFR